MKVCQHPRSTPDRSRRRFAIAALLVSSALTGCNADERTLSFKVGEQTSDGTAGTSNEVPTAMSEAGEGGATSGMASGGTAHGGSGASGGSSSASGGNASGGQASAGESARAGAGGIEPMSGGSASGGANAGSANAGSSNGGAAMAGTGGSAGAPFISPCGDLNHNRVDDCAEALTKNSRFDTDITGWEPESLLQQNWDPTNATGGASSGALRVANVNAVPSGLGNTAAGSRQCVVAWTGQHFDVGARVFIKGGQGLGRAAIDLLIFAGDGCTGTVIEGQTVDDEVATVDSWQVIEGEVAIPAAARSMYVRLVAVKPLAQTSLDVLFDDVLVSERK